MSNQPYIPPVIPVLDLMIGQIVLAQGGNRDQYLPVQTKLTHSAQPLDVAKAMFQQTGCDWLYLADIDSFSGAAPAWRVYNTLLEAGFGLWVDANWLAKDRFLEITDRLPETERLRVIVSSETMTDVAQFAAFSQLRDQGLTPMFSLDKKGDQVLAASQELSNRSPAELVALAWQHGVTDMIVLDLGLVGTMQNLPPEQQTSVLSLVSELVQAHPELQLTSGGGVASAADAQLWLDAGCDHVLVASAIHQCRLTPHDVFELVPRSAITALRKAPK